MSRLLKMIEVNFGLRDAFGGVIQVVNKEELALLQEASKECLYIYLGEIAGKHSEIEGSFTDSDWRVLDVSQEFIKEFIGQFGKCYGAFDIVEAVKESLGE